MKALVKRAAEPGLDLAEVPEPQVQSGQVLIKVARTGICGTDLHIRSWDPSVRSMVTPPVVLGHEIAGHVAAVGPGVDTVVEGDLVSVEGHLVCGRCRNCLAGRRQLCPNTKGVGVHRDGGFAEYISIPASNVWRHPSVLDLEVAAIFDPFGNAVHSALAFPVLGEDVLVTGAGPIGIMAAAVARHAGARHVVVTDLSGYRLDLARRTGVTMAIDPTSTDLRDVMVELDMKEGWDVGLEMSGSPRALADMLDTMANGGRIALLGLPSSEEAPFDWVKTITSMLTIKGIYGREMFETWYAMSVLIAAGLDITPVITHRFPYHEYDEAFDTAASGQCGKVILDWSEA
jgi:threonine 3-dehydrogenase